MQTKTTVSYCYTLPRMAKIKRLAIPGISKDVNLQKMLTRMYNGADILEDFGSFSKS